ncbi:cytochrome c-type biogenesis protein [Agaribacterium haliotis]|uniref:cytochrome c-type biogenesis protein n=1 Tax=Agaribacterium haliotis TaxID=2013869 RepID=UPI000BB52EC6|nr:cytochrome c-type biogenesis protein [Agaribacterium haliotis]
MKNILFLCALLAASSVHVHAEDGNAGLYQFDTDNQRETYQYLSESLRCPKCQNQNLADSNSEIAITMLDVIAEKVLQGQNEEEIKQLMVSRYGDFVLYDPPKRKETALLWWGPPALFFIVALIFVATLMKRSRRLKQEGDDKQNEEQQETGEK